MGQGDSATFHEAPRAQLRAARPWDRLAHIQRALPRAIALAFQKLGVTEASRILDFGCADQPYRSLLPRGATYVGADLHGNHAASVHVAADGRVPLENDSFDAVLSTQVLEHVADPAIYVSECARVLRPGGRLLLSTHGIMVYHPDPVDYWRWTSAGLIRQVEMGGLRLVELTGVMGLAATGIQLFQDATWWRLPRWLKPPYAFVMQLLVRLFDRLEGRHSKAMNALVFIVIAEKPVAPAAPSSARGQHP